MSNVTLKLLDENDNELQVVTTDEEGRFKFDKLAADNDYKILVIDDYPDGAEIYITNSNGQRVAIMNKFGKGTFTFKPLPADDYNDLAIIEIEDESFLTIEVEGQVYKTLPGDYGDGLEVYVINDDGTIVARTVTDKDGKFIFAKLRPDEEYIFALSEEDPDLKIVMMDERGRLLETARRNANGEFLYRRLASEEGVITLIDEEDAIIKFRENDNFILSNIYYDYDKSEITEGAAKELDKLALILRKNKHIKVILSSHTDARAGDDYNLVLSKKRAASAVKYVVSKGVEESRLTGEGLGESQLVNHCSNDVECDEDEHGKNRRTEIKIVAN